jgi:hypothetical protein
VRLDPANATINNEVGLVLGYQAPLADRGDPADRFEFLLLEWSNALTVPPSSGIYLKRVKGTFEKGFDSLRGGGKDARVEVLGYKPGGWTTGKEHDLEVRYEPTRVRISLDGKPLFDVEGKFTPGRIGFYNFGQPDARYSGLSIEPRPPQPK